MTTLAADTAHGAPSGGHGASGGGPWWVTLIPLIPLATTVGIGLCAVYNVKSKFPAWLTVGACAASFALTLFYYLGVYLPSGAEAQTVTAWEWISFAWGDGVAQEFIANFGFRFDGLSLLWMLFVTGLATMIALYASEYMEHDLGLGYTRFFAAFSLFVFSMSALVMGDNLIMLFLGWEGVGLCSYLLIGYYYKKPEAVAAGKKAFIVNRIGDLGLLMGVLLTFTTFGTVEYGPLFDMVQANSTATGATLSETWQAWLIPLLFCAGAFGKSAQLFFYVWLPDAMEGPTPVSALIHAATMVTAGVYLVARMTPVFLQDPNLVGLTVVTWAGTITALWSATIAMAQYDIKRIMGYSTVSQLGYMFAGLGVLAAGGGVFHVVTHAFFKATLFLACGAVMHGFAGQLDMRKLSGLWSIDGGGRFSFRIVVIAMLIGCLNLSGVPFTAGYFSKDMILAEAFYTPAGVIPGGAIAGWILLITAGLTAYYTFRVFFRVFVGKPHYEPGDDLHGADPAHFHPHAPKWAVNTVLVVLGVGSVAAVGLYPLHWADGMLHDSPTHYAAPWAHHGHGDGHADSHGDDHGDGHAESEHAEPVIALASMQAEHDGDHSEDHADGDHSGDHAEDHAGDEHAAGHDDRGHDGDHAAPEYASLARYEGEKHGWVFGLGTWDDPHKIMYYVSAVFGVIGIGAAAFFHGPRGITGLFIGGREEARSTRLEPISAAIRPVSSLAERKWLVDEIYQFLIVIPLFIIANLSHWFDKLVIDGVVDNAGRVPRWVAAIIRPFQSGVLHGYALRMAGGVALVLVIVAILALR